LAAALLLAGAAPLPAHADFQVNTDTFRDQYYSSVAADAAGNFVVVWVGNDSHWDGVLGQRYTSSGAPVGGEFQVNTYTTDSQVDPTVAAGAAGDFVVVWTSFEQDGSFSGIFGQRYDSSGAPAGSEFQINTYTPDLQWFPDLATDASGNFVVVWQSNGQDGSSGGVFAQRYDAGGTPAGPEFQVNATAAGFQGSPAVAADGNGNFLVVWFSEQDGGGTYARRYDSGGAPLSGEFEVIYGGAAVAMETDGDFVVAAVGTDGDEWGIFAQRYDASGVPVGAEFQVNTDTADAQIRPAVAMEPDGDFVVVWEHSYLVGDDSRSGVRARRYASDGTPLGGEFTIVKNGTADLRYPAAAATGDGTFVATWNHRPGDLDDYEVYGQLFNTNPAACAAAPLVSGCRAPLRSRLRLHRDPLAPGRHRLSWKWLLGDETTLADLGYGSAAEYTLCVYEDNAGSPALLPSLTAPAAATCSGGIPCWRLRGSRLYYRDRDAAHDGLTRVYLKADEEDEARASVRGRGLALPDPMLPLTPPLTVQLINAGGQCWTSTFSAPSVLLNDGATFLAVEP
jgi:hypothetical protein